MKSRFAKRGRTGGKLKGAIYKINSPLVVTVLSVVLHPPHSETLLNGSAMFALRGIPISLADQKPLLIENYAILNKRNNLMPQITTMANTVFL